MRTSWKSWRRRTTRSWRRTWTARRLRKMRCARRIRAATVQGKIFPVVCGTAFKNKGIQSLLDAVVDYLPSPADVPPTTGTVPSTGDYIQRKHEDSEPFAALAFKIMTDPFVGKLTFFRVYSGTLAVRILHLQLDGGPPRAGDEDTEDARERTGGDQGGLLRRYRRGRGAEEDHDGRHAVRRGKPGDSGIHGFPRPGCLRLHRAEDQGRRGEALLGPAQALRGGSRPSR